MSFYFGDSFTLILRAEINEYSNLIFMDYLFSKQGITIIETNWIYKWQNRLKIIFIIKLLRNLGLVLSYLFLWSTSFCKKRNFKSSYKNIRGQTGGIARYSSIVLTAYWRCTWNLKYIYNLILLFILPFAHDHSYWLRWLFYWGLIP